MTTLALAALLLPGLAWWAWLGKRDQDSIISLAQVIGISLSLVILIAEAVFFLGGSFSRIGILILSGLFTALAALGFVRKGVKIPSHYHRHLWVGLLLFGATVAWRLLQARSLLLPAWVDSQHHYLIIRAILENRGLPHTLEPYLANPFYYHYGFHAVTALFTAISGLPIGQAMLVFGQILNAFISLSIYALGKTLWKDWRPALGAALLASFVTRMPAYYLSWGRYTLTIGMVLLPLAIAAALQMLEKPHRKRDILNLALLTAGVLLSHYFAAVLLAIFLVVVSAVYLVSNWRQFRTSLAHIALLVTAAVSGLFLASPWLTRVLQFSTASAGIDLNLPETFGEMVSNPDSLDYCLKLLGPTSNHWLIIAAGLGLLLSLARRKSPAFALYSLALALLTLPWSLSLKPFRPDHFAIILFLPVTLLAGWLFWQLGRGLDKLFHKHWMQTALLLLMVATWIIWAFPLGWEIVNPVTVLVSEADIQALEWVKANTPEDARFLINTTHWLNNIYRGVDGGGWLLPYAGRWAVVPTIFYNFSPDIETNRQLQSWGELASAINTCSTEFWQLVEEADLDWIYIREGVGRLQPKGLLGCEGLNLAYELDGVYIYQIIQEE
jgi:hypothetical protein